MSEPMGAVHKNRAQRGRNRKTLRPQPELAEARTEKSDIVNFMNFTPRLLVE
jgi:hypothetical protein